MMIGNNKINDDNSNSYGLEPGKLVAFRWQANKRKHLKDLHQSVEKFSRLRIRLVAITSYILLQSALGIRNCESHLAN